MADQTTTDDPRLDVPQMPAPPAPTFYALQSQALTAAVDGAIEDALRVGEGGPMDQAQVLALSAQAAAVLDLAHAVRQSAATLAQAIREGRRPASETVSSLVRP